MPAAELPRSDLDATARFALKLAPDEMVRWLVPELAADMQFSRWAETEMVAFPGEPRRRCDTAAELVSRSGTTPPWLLVMEVEARLRSSIVPRLLEYQSRVMRRVRHGPHRRDRYQVAVVLLALRGKRSKLSVKMRLPGTRLGTNWRSGLMCLEEEPAAPTLERIARRELGRSILCWVPAMDGGGDPAVVAEWVRLAKEEPNTEKRIAYAAIAQVFAEWAGHGAVWNQALEGWEMWKSQIIKRWQEQARAAGREEGQVIGMQRLLRTLLEQKFSSPLPSDLAQSIAEITDPDKVDHWFLAAWKATSLDEMRGMVQPPGANGN